LASTILAIQAHKEATMLRLLHRRIAVLATFALLAAAAAGGLGAAPPQDAGKTNDTPETKTGKENDAKEKPETVTVELEAMKLVVPAEWQRAEPESRMRLAQFTVPAAKGDARDAELVIFYFGARGAGDVRTNVQRWLMQFDSEDQKSRILRGRNATGAYVLVEVEGTYNEPVGPAIERRTRPFPGSKMLVVFQETRQGPYYIKFAGPKKTVEGATEAVREALSADAEKEKEISLEEV
jgi:hypothetical protein